MGIEAVHKGQGDRAVFRLPEDDVQKGHSAFDLDQGFGTG